MPVVTLYGWWRRWLTGRSLAPAARRCVVWADEQEVARLRKLHHQPAALKIRHRWLTDGSTTTKAM